MSLGPTFTHFYRSLILATALAATSLSNASAVDTGHSEGNAGDAVFVDGIPVLRDFLTAQGLEPIGDNAPFLRSIPGFIPLLEELVEVNPQFALAVWDDLLNANIWTTNSALPLLPKAHTGVAAPAAELQVAIRNGDDILISLPALKKVDSAYLLFHESLQELLDGSGPIHHEKVRSVVRFIKNNRGKLSAAALTQVFSKVSPFDSSIKFYSTDAVETANLKLLLKKVGTEEARCALFSVLVGYRYNSNETLRYHSEPLFSWLETAPCPSDAFATYLKSEFPSLYAFGTQGFFGSAGNTYISTITKNLNAWDYLTRSWDWNWARSQCKRHAAPAVLSEIEQARARLNQENTIVEAVIRELREALDATNVQDPVKLAFVQAWNSANSYRFFLSRDSVQPATPDAIAYAQREIQKALKELSETETIYRQNVETCTKLFDKDYLKN